MRLLASVLHLVVTVWAAYTAPALLLVGVIGYFPDYPELARTSTYVVLALGVAFLGGSTLARTRMWRGRVVLLAVIVWLLAAAVTVPTLLEGSSVTMTSIDLVAPVALDLAPLLLAVGLTAGLYVGARFMRSYDHDSEVPDKSLERTHDR
jgi:hypothetical protein